MSDKKNYAIETAHKNGEMILPDGSTVSLNTWETRRNNNILCIGGTGGGKTRSEVIPNICAAFGSYVITDTKGNLYKKYAPYLIKQGYDVKHLSLIHPEQYDKYDPFFYIKSTNDIQKLAHMVVQTEAYEKSTHLDPFWNQSAEFLISALIGMQIEKREIGLSANFSEVSMLMTKIRADKWEDGEKCDFDYVIEDFARVYRRKTGKESWALEQYNKLRTTPPKTMGCILITLQAILGAYDTEEMRSMFSGNDIDIPSIGTKKTAVFVEISDTDRSKDAIANIFYSQVMNGLCMFADEECENSRLPVPVRFILDDFGTNCKISGFENMISNIRSREISAIIILQSIYQLFASYGANAHTIIDDCDTMIYLGGNDISTAQEIAIRCNKPLDRVLRMPLGMNWIVRRGEEPRYSRTVDLSEYDMTKYENISKQANKNTKNHLAGRDEKITP